MLVRRNAAAVAARSFLHRFTPLKLFLLLDAPTPCSGVHATIFQTQSGAEYKLVAQLAVNLTTQLTMFEICNYFVEIFGKLLRPHLGRI
jgi:hypothetical protein